MPLFFLPLAQFFPTAQFQNSALQCLGEVANLTFTEHPKAAEYGAKFHQMFSALMGNVGNFLSAEVNVAQAYKTGNPQVQEFVRYLSLFVCNFLKNHLGLLERGDDATKTAIGQAIMFILRISQVDDVVIFKICLEFWLHLVTDVYNSQKVALLQAPGLMLGRGFGGGTQRSPRLQMYAPLLSQLRLVLIGKMAKPEEVLVVEDENGEIVRESMRDTDDIILYKTMRDCLVYLTNLDPIDTQTQMLGKLQLQMNGQEWSWHNLNTLCWAVGSISGAMSEEQEKSFVVTVIKELLSLVEMKRGKDNKAIIASNIMYVVGQYPRFLKQHWRFLKTVVNKLFEFMHEKHPGVQDMVCLWQCMTRLGRACVVFFVVD